MADDHAPLPRTKAELLARVRFPTDESAYQAEIQRGLDDIAAGRVISAEKVHGWVRSLGTEHELPPPECD